jgi:hypothetical protein
VELAIRTAMVGLGGALLDGLLRLDPGHRGPRVDCGNGHQAEFVSYQGKTIDTVVGPPRSGSGRSGSCCRWNAPGWPATTATGTGCWIWPGLTDTLIADADGIYHPAMFNDRLVLGMKGTMSEAELHILRSRLDGGIRNKAARGELRRGLPAALSGAKATERS